MCQFIETIRIDSGEARNLTYHEQRLNDTRNHFCPAAMRCNWRTSCPPFPKAADTSYVSSTVNTASKM